MLFNGSCFNIKLVLFYWSQTSSAQDLMEHVFENCDVEIEFFRACVRFVVRQNYEKKLGKTTFCQMTKGKPTGALV